MVKRKILFVDDNDEIRDLIGFTLENAGYETISAQNGRLGFEMARLHNPDLIITDVDMPLINGFELCNMIRHDKMLHMTPVIVLTGSRTHPTDRIAGLKIGADDYILKPFLPEELSLRVERLIKRAEEHISVNPLTKLPGTLTLEARVVWLIENKQPFTACYFDLDHFKAFNDHYGYAKGDVVIKLLAGLILKASGELGNNDDVLIHIGGDDFILLSTREKAELTAQRVIQEFTEQIPTHYDENARRQGYITSVNRKGQTENFPVMTLSIAAISTGTREITRYEQMVDILCEIKKFAKAHEGSIFIHDRRTK